MGGVVVTTSGNRARFVEIGRMVMAGVYMGAGLRPAGLRKTMPFGGEACRHRWSQIASSETITPISRAVARIAELCTAAYFREIPPKIVGGGQDGSTLYNCTVVGNEATNRAGGCYAGTLYNCIVWSNRATSDSNFWGGTYTYCCTTPNPGGIGNLSDDPRFVNAAGEDYHLQSNSPCVNAGTNQDWMIGATELDGRFSRIRGGRVDMGAYERMLSLMPDDWLERYDLALDGSDDFRDNDEDGMDNWREWRCETDPTNRWSLLKCIADNSMVTPTGIVVCWQSVAGKMYTVERSTNLSVSSPFIEIATDILAEAENTTHTDTTAVGSGPWFYRVGVK